jgi:hypothetical protein
MSDFIDHEDVFIRVWFDGGIRITVTRSGQISKRYVCKFKRLGNYHNNLMCPKCSIWSRNLRLILPLLRRNIENVASTAEERLEGRVWDSMPFIIWVFSAHIVIQLITTNRRQEPYN